MSRESDFSRRRRKGTAQNERPCAMQRFKSTWKFQVNLTSSPLIAVREFANIAASDATKRSWRLVASWLASSSVPISAMNAAGTDGRSPPVVELRVPTCRHRTQRRHGLPGGIYSNPSPRRTWKTSALSAQAWQSTHCGHIFVYCQRPGRSRAQGSEILESVRLRSVLTCCTMTPWLRFPPLLS